MQKLSGVFSQREATASGGCGALFRPRWKKQRARETYGGSRDGGGEIVAGDAHCFAIGDEIAEISKGHASGK